MPKTGTSSLQFSLADYDDGEWAFAQIRMATRDVNHSVVLVLSAQSQGECEKLVGHPRELDQFPRIFDRLKSVIGKTPDILEYRNALIKAFDTATDRNIILSGESVFWEVNCQLGLHDLLSQHFDDILVVCYLRPFGEQVIARVQQRLRISDPEGFFEIPGLFVDACLSNSLQIDVPLKTLSTAFGKSNLRVLPFSKSTLGWHGLVFDFMNRFELRYEMIKEIRTNESMSAEACAILYALSTLGTQESTDENFGASKLALNNLLSDFGHCSLGVSEALAVKINDLNQIGIKWVLDEYAFSIEAQKVNGDFCIKDFTELLDLATSQIPAFCQHLAKKWDITFPVQSGELAPFIDDLLEVLRHDLRWCVLELPKGFEEKAYLTMYEDVRQSGMSGQNHFLKYGYFEGRLF